MLAGTAEATCPALAKGKFLDNIKLHLQYRHNHQLRHALHRHQRKRVMASVPQRNEYLPLIVRINQSNQIAQHNAVFVAEPGTRQDHRRTMRISQMNGYAAGDEFALAGLDNHAVGNAGAQINSRRAGRGIGGRMILQARIQDFDIYHFFS